MVCKNINECKNKMTPKDVQCKCMEDPEVALYVQVGCCNLTNKDK